MRLLGSRGLIAMTASEPPRSPVTTPHRAAQVGACGPGRVVGSPVDPVRVGEGKVGVVALVVGRSGSSLAHPAKAPTSIRVARKRAVRSIGAHGSLTCQKPFRSRVCLDALG